MPHETVNLRDGSFRNNSACPLIILIQKIVADYIGRCWSEYGLSIPWYAAGQPSLLNLVKISRAVIRWLPNQWGSLTIVKEYGYSQRNRVISIDCHKYGLLYAA